MATAATIAAAAAAAADFVPHHPAAIGALVWFTALVLFETAFFIMLAYCTEGHPVGEGEAAGCYDGQCACVSSVL